MFYPDLPITSSEDDILGRKKFSQQLAKSIINYKNSNSLTIGLYGDWGTGKSSILNMVNEYIDIQFENNNNEKPVVFTFNPWNFSDQNQLLHQFFKQLSNTLNKPIYDKRFNKIANVLEQYSIIFDVITPAFGFWGILVLLGLKVVSIFNKRSSTKQNDLNLIKNKVNVLLKKLNSKIIIIIDDIDRLNNSEIRQIFQLVKSIADFTNTIYILAFDPKVVKHSLSDFQGIDGNKYLEKVIQVPFQVPHISESKISEVLFNRINEIIKDLSDEQFDKYYWGNMYLSSIKYFFKSIRDIIRYINLFEFNYSILKDEVNVVDLLAITAIQTFNRELYYNIRDNKELFTNSPFVQYRMESVSDMQQRKEEHLQKILSSISDEFRMIIHDLLYRLFPDFTSRNAYDARFDEWNEQKRICSYEKFDIYFKYDLAEKDFSESEFLKILGAADNAKDFANQLISLYKEDRVYRFLELLERYVIKNKQNEYYFNILCVFFEIGDSLCITNNMYYNEAISGLIFSITYKIIFNLDSQQKRFETLKNIFKITEKSIFQIVDFVSYLDSEYGKYEKSKETKPSDQYLVNEGQLNELEAIANVKIKDWSTNFDLEAHPKLPKILHRWERWGKNNEVVNYISEKKKDITSLIRLLSCFVYRVGSRDLSDYVNKESYDLYYKDIEYFFKVDDLETIIRKFNISELNDQKQKEFINLFLDYYDKKRIDYKR